MDIVEFCEKYIGAKLYWYQKIYLRAISKFAKKQKITDLYLHHLGQQQTRRSSDGRLLLPEDDDPEDEELIPESLRKANEMIDSDKLLREALVRNAEYISPDVDIEKWIDGK